MDIDLDDFVLEEMPFRIPGNESLAEDLCRDDRFTSIQSGDGEILGVSRRAAYFALLRANLRVAAAGRQPATSAELGYWLGWPGARLSEESCNRFIAWFQGLGLIDRSAQINEYALPLGQFVSDICGKTALRVKYLAEFYQAVKVVYSEKMDSSVSVAGFLDEALKYCDERTRTVLALRMTKTLEQIGKTLRVSRERVRQLEATAIRKAQLRPWVWNEAVIRDFKQHGGVRIADSKSVRAHSWWTLSCITGIPTAEIEGASLIIIGLNGHDCEFAGWEKWEYSDIFQGTAFHKLTKWRGGLAWRDIGVLRTEFKRMRVAKMFEYDRILCAMEHIKRPAHYSEITTIYNELFPKTKQTDRNLHAVLGRFPKEIAYVGRKGTYGLTKYGAVKPKVELYELVVDVLKRRCELMRVALPFDVVLAAVRKERPGADSTSVKMILGFKAQQTAAGHWFPLGGIKEKEKIKKFTSKYAPRMP